MVSSHYEKAVLSQKSINVSYRPANLISFNGRDRCLHKKFSNNRSKEPVYIIASPGFLFLRLQVCQFTAEETLRSPIFLI